MCYDVNDARIRVEFEEANKNVLVAKSLLARFLTTKPFLEFIGNIQFVEYLACRYSYISSEKLSIKKR